MKNDRAKKDSIEKESAELADLQKLRELVENGQISAIAVDTCAFDEHGMRLDKGLFSQLRQFGRHPAHFIISEVVLSEIRNHLVDHLLKAKDRFGRSMLDTCEFLGGDNAEVTALKEKLDVMPPIEILCESQINSFCNESKVDVIPADAYVKVSEILNLYFQRKPPFQAENPKKSEFPDAIALTSLEGWAAAKDTQVIVVSRDGDWKSFCDGSKRLHLVKNLEDALNIFQSPDEIVTGMLNYLGGALCDSASPLMETLKEIIGEFDWDPNIESYSQLEYESEEVVEIFDVHFNDESADAIKVTQHDEENISTVFRLWVNGQVTVYYTFRKWDSIDKEYIPMGSTHVNEDFLSTVSVVLKMPIRNGAPYEFDISIQPEPLHFEFQEVEPNWMRGNE